MQWAGWWIVVRSYVHRVIETERREYQECAVGIDEHRAPIIDHLVRRGAGAEDEVLVEAVPAQLGGRDVARQGCEKQRGEGPPSHAGSRTRFREPEPELLVPALLVPNAICRGNGSKAHLPAVPKNDFLSHLFQVPRLAFFFPVIEGT